MKLPDWPLAITGIACLGGVVLSALDRNWAAVLWAVVAFINVVSVHLGRQTADAWHEAYRTCERRYHETWARRLS